MPIKLKRAIPGRLVGGRFVPNPKRSVVEEVLYKKFRKEGYSRGEAKKFAKLNAPYFQSKNPKTKQTRNCKNPPLGKWLKVEGSPVKRIRFRKGGNVDVVILNRSAANPSSYVVYPGNGTPKSFGFLKSAKKWAKEQANSSGISSVIYPQGKEKTHHVSPDKKKTSNPREKEYYVTRSTDQGRTWKRFGGPYDTKQEAEQKKRGFSGGGGYGMFRIKAKVKK